MNNLNEQRFYEALENIFVGANIDGVGGYVNLLKIKHDYYKGVLEVLKSDINNDPILDGPFREEFFSKLYTYFERYFNESGSIYFSKTSNWQSVYEKIYTDTKDVILFWKTNMLYYVKTDTLYQNILVEVKDENMENITFNFNVDKLETKKSNEKRELVFAYNSKNKMLLDDKEVNVTVIDVFYSTHGRRTRMDEIIKDSELSEITITRAINAFSNQSKVDYFINKNAKIFLEEQLDLYLNEILLEETNVFSQDRLNQIKTIKKYGKLIINFISQFEDELIKVWIKPKFALNGNYIISIDRLSDETLSKIETHENFKLQLKEWIDLKFIEREFEKFTDEYIHLPIDTKYFKDIETEILSNFDHIDNELDGTLVHSENFQALNMLENKYESSIQSIYIDPPFNTGKDFEYIDNYQDSTWLSIMSDRLKMSHNYLSESGQISLHLDRYANYLGRYLLDDIYGSDNYRAEIYYDTNGNTGFKTSKNNWFQNTNVIIQYAKSYSETYFRKAYTLFDNKDYNNPKNIRRDKRIMWLDLFKDEEGDYIEKYDDGKLIKMYQDIDIKVDPIGMIWTDILSFLYTQVGNNESYFFSGGQKPEHLIARIINTSTKQRDYVLDFFAGSGTTCAVAHKLNRRYLGIEMGDHFNTFYDNKTRIGLLGRMKNVINGDSTFYALKDGSMSVRRPQLTRQIDWKGGGFVKYYDLEQYEDSLSKMSYSQETTNLFSNQDPFDSYIFYADKKLTEVININNENNIDFNFEHLYENIDWPETISLLTGMNVKSIHEKEFILEKNNMERKVNIDFANMSTFEKMEFLKLIKPLIWWGD